MFVLRDIVEIAITIEKNGARTYREASEKVKREDLAELLAFLANDELDHVRWFEELAATIPESETTKELVDMGRSMLRGVVGAKSFSLDDIDLARSETVAQVLDAALELELDTVIFYQMLGGFVDDPKTREHLGTIIEEEKRHGRFLQEFLETGRLPSRDEYASVPP